MVALWEQGRLVGLKRGRVEGAIVATAVYAACDLVRLLLT